MYCKFNPATHTVYLRLSAVASRHNFGGRDEGSTTEVAAADLEGSLPWDFTDLANIFSSNNTLVTESRGG